MPYSSASSVSLCWARDLIARRRLWVDMLRPCRFMDVCAAGDVQQRKLTCSQPILPPPSPNSLAPRSTFNDDFTLADPSAFTLPTFPLSQQTAGTAYPTSYLPGPASAGAPQFISPGLLGGSSVPPSLVGGLLPPAPPVAAATASAGGHGSSVYSHGGSTYNSSDDTRYEAASVLSNTLSQSRSQRHQSFSIAPPTNAAPATASAAVQQPKKAASSVGGGSDGGVPQRYKRTKTGCLCCRQRRVRCCETCVLRSTSAFASAPR